MGISPQYCNEKAARNILKAEFKLLLYRQLLRILHAILQAISESRVL